MSATGEVEVDLCDLGDDRLHLYGSNLTALGNEPGAAASEAVGDGTLRTSDVHV